MRARRRVVLTFAAVLLSLLALTGTARAGEIVDGNNPPTVRNNMHSCPPGYIVTGVHVGNNQLLCLGLFNDVWGFLTTGEAVVSGNLWPPDPVTRAAYTFGSTSIPWCGPDRYVTGVHVANRQLNCARFPAASNINYTPRLGHIIIDSGATLTQRNNMHACPRGFVLVGANFDTNTFLCAELPFCKEDSHCPGAGEVCEYQSAGCGEDCLFPTTGVCRRQGLLDFREDPNCQDDSDGWLTDRSGTAVNFTANDGFDNDDSESLHLNNVHAGTVIRVFDDSTGSTGDDWTEVLVKSTTTTCINSFESSFENSALKVTYHPVSDLNDEVSRVDVRSVLFDYAGRCIDVNTNDNSIQVFPCHAGINQRWTYLVTGEIRGWNNLCLEANNTDIQGWPNLAAGQTRRASVRVATCNGGIHQKWSVTEAGQICMFGDMCLDIVGGTSFDQAAVQLFPCHGGQNQRWVSSF